MKRSFKFRQSFALIAGLTILLSASLAQADSDAVKKYTDQAADLIKNSSGTSAFSDAGSKLDLAEAAMDDVPAGEKPALQARIDDLRKTIASGNSTEEKRRLDDQVKGLLNDLESNVASLVVFPGKADEFNTLVNDPKTKAVLGETAVANYVRQFNTLNKVFQSKALKANLEAATTEVSELEKRWVEVKPQYTNDLGRGGAIDTMQRSFDSIDQLFAKMPAENDDVKALKKRVDTIRAASNAEASSAVSGSEVERVNRWVDGEKNAWEGMDSETTEPTWADFKSGKQMARDFNAPKTKQFISATNHFLKELNDEADYKATKDDPKVKTVVEGLRLKYEAARAKVLKNATKIVNEAEKDKIDGNSNSEVGYLASCIDSTFDTTQPDAKALSDRAKKIQQNYLEGSKKEDDAADSLMKTMNDQAAKAWPEMEKKFDISTGYDANNPGALSGKYIRIVSDNLMGWRFSPGDFPFATTLNGVPVAGEYSQTVRAAIQDAEKKFGAKFTDDDQGKWTVIAKVTTRSGKLTQILNSSGDVRVDGSKVGTVETTEHKSVDAPIVTIVALHAGPVAVAEGQGAVTADGTVATPVGVASSGRGIGGRLWSILMSLLAIVVGAACLMKAKFAPLATNAQAMELSNKVGGDNIAYLGLAGVALGALGILLNLVALPHAFFGSLVGLVASAALVIAGGVASRDFLATRNLVPAKADQIMTQYALPAGLVCAGLGVLTLLMAIL